MPDGFHYLAAFDLNVGPDDGLNVPVQLGIKVDPSVVPGTKVYFWQAGDYLNDDGSTQPIWWQVESGVVGSDGYAHTSSKPYPGVINSSRYMLTYGDPNLGTLQLQQALASKVRFTVALAEGIGLVGAWGAPFVAGALATMAVPSTPAPEPFRLQEIPQEGLPVTTVTNFQIDPAEVNRYQTSVRAPVTPFSTAPQINTVSVNLPLDPATNLVRPEVVLTGTRFTTQGQLPQDLKVTFTMPGNPALQVTVNPSANSTSTEIHALVPDIVTLGLASITVTRQDQVPIFSNGHVKFVSKNIVSAPAKIDPNGTYVFVALPEAKYTSYGVEGDLAVLNGDPSSPSTIGDLVARIPLEPFDPAAAGSNNGYVNIPYPRDVAVTPDNTRAYVTLLGSGRVAVVDTISLQEIDANAGRQPLTFPPHTIAAPSGVAVDPALHSAVLTDPVDVRGTVRISNLGSWQLELVSFTGTSVVLSSGTSAVSSDVLLANFNPAQYQSGFYRFRLTAYDKVGNPVASDSSVIFDMEANPTFKEIRMPFGAQPYGIAISPDGKYAYVAAHNPYTIGAIASSYVFQIDIDPTSPTYNRVVRNIAVGSVDIGGVVNAANLTTQRFDVRGQLLTYQDSFGHHTENAYDGMGRLVRETKIDDLFPQNNQFSGAPIPGLSPGVSWAEQNIYVYLPGGQIQRTFNGLGQETDYFYDGGNRLREQVAVNVLQADGSTTSVRSQYFYDEDSNLVRQVNFRDAGKPGIVTRNTYDDLSRLRKVEILSGSSSSSVGIGSTHVVMTTDYDLVGNKIATTDLHNNVTTYLYDPLYRLVTTRLPVSDGNGHQAEIETGYDLAGDKVMQTDANGNATYLVYDADYRIISSTDPVGKPIIMIFPIDGREFGLIGWIPLDRIGSSFRKPVTIRIIGVRHRPAVTVTDMHQAVEPIVVVARCVCSPGIDVVPLLYL